MLFCFVFVGNTFKKSEPRLCVCVGRWVEKEREEGAGREKKKERGKGGRRGGRRRRGWESRERGRQRGLDLPRLQTKLQKAVGLKPCL